MPIDSVSLEDGHSRNLCIGYETRGAFHGEHPKRLSHQHTTHKNFRFVTFDGITWTIHGGHQLARLKETFEGERSLKWS